MSSSYFKCNSCSIQFPNSDSQRFHMKTDWHRYNLKRRVADLPPVDAATFTEKLQISKRFEEETDEFGFKIPKAKEPKKLHIHNYHNALNHRGRVIDIPQHDEGLERATSPASTVATGLSHFSLGDSVFYSQTGTHSDLDSNFETDSEPTTHSDYDHDYEDEEDEDEDADESYRTDDNYEEEPLQPITSCIYCGLPHRDVETNVTHMFKSHGLYIPERSYLSDLKGLLEYLISIIVIDNVCLCCSFKGKNLESIRAHATSKGHCRVPYETRDERAEFERFYDFSSINSKVEKSKSKKSVGFSEDADVTITADEEDVDGEDDDSEDVSDDDLADTNNYTLATIDPVDSGLSLPNGARLGNRSLNRIYRQRIHIPSDPSDAQLTLATADRRLAGGLTLQQYNKEQKAVQIVESKAQSRNIRREIRRANFQTHFRDQMLGG